MKRLALALVLAVASAGATAAITVVNESSLVSLPDAPITAKIVRGQSGLELVVIGVVSDRTASGEHLAAAEVNFVTIQSDGAVLWSGPSDMLSGNRLEWRLMLKPDGVVDGDLIAQVKITDRKIVTGESQERKAPELAETAVTIPVINESSVVPLPEAPFTATMVRGQYGLELAVNGIASDRTITGEHLKVAEIDFVANAADGTVLASGSSTITAGEHADWRHLGGLHGFVEGRKVAQVKMTDKKVVTIERYEREVREQAETERQATIKRKRQANQKVLERKRLRESAIRAHRWPEHLERAVIERKIMLGMNGEQVSMSWGPPERINQTITVSGKSEQWVYSRPSYVYFENGRVTAIQSSR